MKTEHRRTVVMDTATLYGLLHALTLKKANDWPLWTLQSAHSATILPLACQWLQLPPAPKRPYYSELIGLLITRLNGFLGKQRPDSKMIGNRADVVNNIIVEYPENALQRLDYVRRSDSYEGWLEHAINRFWPELSTLQSGLFDVEFAPALAVLIDGVSEAEIRKVWEISRQEKTVKSWSRKRNTNEDFEICRQAYFVNNCLRGEYYDGISRDFYPNEKIVLHPMRQTFLADNNVNPIELERNLTLDYMAAVILGAAMSQRTHKERINNWCENVKKVREAMWEGYVELSDIEGDTALREKKVWTAVRQAELNVHAKSMEKMVSGIVSLITALASWTLGTWMNPVAGPLVTATGAVFAFTKAPALPVKATKHYARRQSRIKSLNELGGGRLMQERGSPPI